MREHKIGVVVVSYNSEDDLPTCIKSVKKQINSRQDIEAIVIDNNSKDLSLKVARELGVHTIANNKNLGFSKAVNIGVKAAYALNCDLILILNPDAILGEKSLEYMIKTFNSNLPDSGAVGPMMVNRDGSSANEGYYLKAPTFLTVSLFSTLLRAWSIKNKYLLSKYEESLSNKTTLVDQIPGACLLTSRGVLEDIGMLDEDFAIWFEDVEWSYRARKNGYKLYFCPRSKVIHEGGVSFSKWKGLEKSVTFYVSMKTFFKKHKPFSYYFILAVLCLNALVSYLKGRDKDQLKFIRLLIKQKKGSLPS